MGTRTLRLGCLAAVAAALVSSCDSGQASRNQAVPRLPAAAPALPSGSQSTDSMVLPIQGYVFGPKENGELVVAHSMLVRRCMQGFGYDYAVPSLTDTAQAASPMRSRYGVASVSDAAEGYHFMVLSMDGAGQGQGGSPPARQTQPPQPADANEMAVLYGQGAQTVAGRTVPSGGCNAVATTELGGKNGRYGSADLSEGIMADGFVKSQTDPAVVAGFRAWSACMKRSGYSYDTPLAAMGDQKWWTSSTPSSAEIATARADVACKGSTDLLNTWFAAEARYENQAIEADAEQLQQVQVTMQAEVTKAIGILGTSS